MRRQDGVKGLVATEWRCVDGGMDDVVFVAVFVVMMTLAFGYVRWCERIVRSDEQPGQKGS